MITSTVKMRVRIGGITNCEPPCLLYSKIVTRSDGKQKLFSQMAQVTDAELLERLRREARNGDEAEVTVEQRLGGGIVITLLDFPPVPAPIPEVNTIA